jgi:ATP-binding cassette subfamily B protein
LNKQTITRPAVSQVLRDYWRQYKRSPLYTILSFFLPAVGNIFIFFVPPLIVASIINIIASPDSVETSVLAWKIILFGLSWLFGEACWRAGQHFIIRLETEGVRSLGKLSFRRLTARDYDFYTNNFVGSLTKKAAAFSKGFEGFTDTLSYNIVPHIMPAIFAIIVLWGYSPWIPAILVICIGITASVSLPLVRKRASLVAEQHAASSRVVGWMSDSITNMLAVKAFAQEDRELDFFSERIDDHSEKFKRANDYSNLNHNVIVSPLYAVTNAIGLAAATFLTLKLGLEAGVVVVVFTYFAVVSRVFWDISNIYRRLESTISEAAEFTQLFLDAPAIQDIPDAPQLKVSNPTISFEHANFKYDGHENEGMFLKNFNLHIKANERVGLVGPSGSGKTTLTKLLLRFISLHSGSITIDGQDISKVSQASLRQVISYVPQEPLLFHRSLFDNIAYGSAGATEGEVKRAAQLARADEFIRRLPQGYDTLVGERGIKLSGGQRQRIAIARALVKHSPILVLDEATSSLDSESEKYIQEGLWELMKDKTALVIAHRLSTIKHLDRIVVLDHGRIVQDGTHEELIKEKGLYAKLWSHQSGDFLQE